MVMTDGGQAAVLPTHHGHGVNDDRQAAALSDTGHSAMVSMMTIRLQWVSSRNNDQHANISLQHSSHHDQ